MVEEDPEELPITGLFIITPGIKNSMRVNLITPGIKNPTHPSQHLENKDDVGQRSYIDDSSMPNSNLALHKLRLLSRLECLCNSMALQMTKSKARHHLL
ncbi:hypothetical protein L2E82_47177 [Cichorium intybus]|uniref:Uncharacterized protein n=1 Tax=Cichorium intybus TaxID=13427 RepID=A0ACB8YV34_CICIN|nr:hypothetical protein L2E82_47177 [Cichorium intybus]